MSMSFDDTSLQIFRRYIKRSVAFGVDASMVLSKECYLTWLNSRKIVPTKPEEAFRRVLTAHVRGSDGRKPFHAEEEEAILEELRRKEIWPCFLDTGVKIGINGFRAEGYHEKNRSETQKTNLRLPNLRPLNKSSTKESQIEDKKVKCRSKYLSSYEVFQMFAPCDETGHSRILSKECFNTWVQTRRSGVKSPEHSFRKALIAHLCGKDGRRPFPISSERSIVCELRKKQVWPCFQDRTETNVLNIGKKGFRHYGYHETLAQEQARQHSSQFNSSMSTRPKPNMHDLLHNQRQNELREMRTHKISKSLAFAKTKSNRGEQEETAAAGLLHYFSSKPTVNAPQNQLKRNSNGEVPAVSSLLKRPKYSLPSVFVNSTDANNKVDRLLCYDSNEDCFSHFLENDLVQSSAGNNVTVVAPALDTGLYSSYQPVDPFKEFLEAETERETKVEKNTSPNSSILESFSDVTKDEIAAVLTLKHLSLPLYKEHYAAYGKVIDLSNVPIDVGGEVKLLRILRACKGNISESINEVQQFLKYRKQYNVDEMREELLEKNMSYETLRSKVCLGRRGGFYPFFAQEANGDITDVFILIPQLDPTPELIKEFLIDHIKVAEFRSIVLDRLSYLKKRVVKFKVLYDWTNVKKKDEKIKSNGQTCLGWMASLRIYGKFLKELIEVYTRWYCTSLSSCHVFGSGIMFRLFASTVTRAFFGPSITNLTQFVGNPQGYEKVFNQCLGDRSLWPTWIEGGKKNPENTELSTRQISSFAKTW